MNENTYIKRHKLIYPVNVGRNIAKSFAKTKYVLVSDIELYPSPNLSQNFIKMIKLKHTTKINYSGGGGRRSDKDDTTSVDKHK